ncbi:MAG: hypothetical protein ACT6Q8_04440 [Niveispirillum sp.]|uniref:hypothetical protein n=1 Tax=Niveispirillum sp. TaxID=1917217 RepID=UPI00403603E7
MMSIAEMRRRKFDLWHVRGQILFFASLPVILFAYFAIGFSVLSPEVVRDDSSYFAEALMPIFSLLLIPFFLSRWVNAKLKKPGLALALSAPTVLLVCVMDGYVILALIWDPLMMLLSYLGL